MRVAAFLSAVVLTTAAALAEGPAPAVPAKPTAEPSAYCRSAAQALFQGGAGDAEITAVTRACRRGDIIAISTGAQGSVFQVGRLCDFTKSVVVMGTQTLCVLGAERAVR